MKNHPASLRLLLLCVLAAQPGRPQQLTSSDQVSDGLVKSDWATICAA